MTSYLKYLKSHIDCEIHYWSAGLHSLHCILNIIISVSAPLEDNDEDQTDNIVPCLYDQRNEDTDDYHIQRAEDWLIGEDPAMFSDEFSDPDEYNVTFDY